MHEVGLALDGCDLCEIWLERFSAERLEPLLVHPGRVEIPDLLLDRAGRGVAGRKMLDDRANVLLRRESEPHESAISRQIGRNLKSVEPTPVRIAVEVITWGDGFVARRQIDAPRADLGGLRGRGRRRGRAGGGFGPSAGSVTSCDAKEANNQGVTLRRHRTFSIVGTGCSCPLGRADREGRGRRVIGKHSAPPCCTRAVRLTFLRGRPAIAASVGRQIASTRS